MPLVARILVFVLEHIEQAGSQALRHWIWGVAVMSGMGRGGRQEQRKYKSGEDAGLHRLDP